MKIQYDSLTKVPTSDDLSAFKKQAPEIAQGVKAWQYGIAIALGSGFGMQLAFLFGSRQPILLAILLIVLVLAGGGVGWYICHVLSTRKLRKRYQLYSFAQANGFEYTPRLTSSDEGFRLADRGGESSLPAIQTGMVYAAGGHSERIEDRLTKPGVFEISNYYYVTGSGKSQQSHDWGYIRIPLKRQLPHIVLDAKKNNTGLFGFSITNLPLSFNKSQTLSLEGDFDNYFTLYAPKEYERDALYIFTPDLMALLIDESSQFDVEIVDSALYVYSSVPFTMQNPKVLNRLFAIIDAVGNKMTKATERYADERVPNAREVNIVAPGGTRLKQGIPALTIIVVIIIVWNFIRIFL